MKKTPLFLLILIIGLLAVAGFLLIKPIFSPNEPDLKSDVVEDGEVVGDDEESDDADKAETRQVSLYYYNPSLDKDAQGNILCSEKGLQSVERTVPVTNTPIQDAVKLLLEGKLTDSEKRQGITTEFPLRGLELVGASLNRGVLKLEFKDDENRTSGGACRVGVLWSQIEKTAMQFSGVESVEFIPEELFQP